jgi:hypothetical protein
MFYEDGVVFEHCNNAEPDTATPPHCVRSQRFVGEGRPPYMEMNFGASWAELVNKMKLEHEMIGRNHHEQGLDVWLERALHGWGWVLSTGKWFFMKIFTILFAFWKKGWMRRILMTVRVVIATFRPGKETEDVEAAYLKRLREKFTTAVAFVTGHTHAPGRRTAQIDDGSKRSVTYANSGTWVKMFRLVWMTFPRTWKNFRWLEPHIRAFGHFMKTGKISYARRAAEIIGYLGVLTVIAVFVAVNFPGKEHILFWNISLSSFQIPAIVAFVFVVLAGLIRFFAVQPGKEPFRKLTFVDVSYVRTETLDAEGKVTASEAGEYRVDCMEWIPEQNEVRECV